MKATAIPALVVNICKLRTSTAGMAEPGRAVDVVVLVDATLLADVAGAEGPVACDPRAPGPQPERTMRLASTAGPALRTVRPDLLPATSVLGRPPIDLLPTTRARTIEPSTRALPMVLAMAPMQYLRLGLLSGCRAGGKQAVRGHTAPCPSRNTSSPRPCRGTDRNGKPE